MRFNLVLFTPFLMPNALHLYIFRSLYTGEIYESNRLLS